MRPQLVLVSTNQADVDLYGKIAFSAGCTFASVYTIEAVRRTLSTNREAVVVIESDGRVEVPTMVRAASAYLLPKQVFLVSSLMPTYRLKVSETVGGYFHRRSAESAVDVYSNVIGSALKKHSRVFESFSDSNRAIKISRVTHKVAAVKAFTKYLEKAGFSGRLLGLVTQSVDELITNAIFDAPILRNGFRPLHSRPRHLEIQLDDDETIEMKLASNPKYVVVSVADQYGSFELDTFIRSTLQSTTKSDAEVESSGLKAIYQTGISMSFNLNPQKKTEITLVIPRVSSYREFKTGFRFLQVIEERT